MAFNKTLAHRLFKMTKWSSQTLSSSCRILSARMPPNKEKIDPGDYGISKRFIYKGTEFSPENIRIPTGDNLIDKIRELGVSKDRIQLETMLPPNRLSPSSDGLPMVSLADARKLVIAAEMQMVRSRLKEIGKAWVSYSEFVRACAEACSDPDRAIRVANMLDESGNVVVLGKSVCLRPDQITKTLEGLVPKALSATDEAKKTEFEKLKSFKSEIDKRADVLVRRELWAGLGFLAFQTLGFMRLTFWELTWDVMEPICFFVTSAYFMAGYGFFLRTSKEPSFEGFYQSRFNAKQKRLMTVRNFDNDRFMELQAIFCPNRSGVC